MPAWGTGEIAALRLADESVRWQRSLRWQKPARNWRRLLPGLAAGILCTALPILLFDAGMRADLRRLHALAPDVPIIVELLDAPPPPPTPPMIVGTAATVDRRRPRPVEAPSPPAITSTRAPVAPEPAAPLQLFGQDGAIRLPESETSAQKTFGVPEGKALAHDNPVPYEETRFDRMMPSIHESLGGELVRKTTYTHTWHTRLGTRITCMTSLVMAGLGICGWGVEPRATADELRAMRADPPMPKEPKPGDAP
jgi:hypothetical protein